MICPYCSGNWGKLRFQTAEDWWIFPEAIPTVIVRSDELMSIHRSEGVW